MLTQYRSPLDRFSSTEHLMFFALSSALHRFLLMIWVLGHHNYFEFCFQLVTASALCHRHGFTFGALRLASSPTMTSQKTRFTDTIHGYFEHSILTPIMLGLVRPLPFAGRDSGPCTISETNKHKGKFNFDWDQNKIALDEIYDIK